MSSAKFKTASSFATREMQGSSAVAPSHFANLPPELCTAIFSYLSFDQCSQVREVCRKFDRIAGDRLTAGYRRVEAMQRRMLHGVKANLPRRESERRNHPLSKHSDILTSIETRLSLLNMTYTKFTETKQCCFIPGKVVDELFSVLRIVQSALDSNEGVPRPHDTLQELRDISSMAMEHFDEHISDALRSSPTYRSPSTFLDSLAESYPQLNILTTFRSHYTPMTLGGQSASSTLVQPPASAAVLTQIAELVQLAQSQSTKMAAMQKKITELTRNQTDVSSRVTELSNEVHKKCASKLVVHFDDSASTSATDDALTTAKTLKRKVAQIEASKETKRYRTRASTKSEGH